MNSFWPANGSKPKRMLGRRSMCVNRTNTTLSNSSMNVTAKNVDFSSTLNKNEPSCASTPLPDHNKNKENIYLSSIKGPYQSPKSARKVPYHLPRKSPYAKKTIATDLEESINIANSVRKMENINTCLKLTESKPVTKVDSITDKTSSRSYLNFDRYHLLKKYFAQPVLKAPEEPESRYEAWMKKKYETITETSESTTEIIAAPNNVSLPVTNSTTNIADPNETENTVVQYDLQIPSPTNKNKVTNAEMYGSFIENISCTSDNMEVTVLGNDRTEESNEHETNDAREPKNVIQQSEEKSEELNRTFEITEDDSMYKTPKLSRSLKKWNQNNSVIFKTPTANFSRILDIDENDSFVEYEKTLMMEFNKETTLIQPNNNELSNTSIKLQSNNEIKGKSESVNTNNSHQKTTLEKFIQVQNENLDLFLERFLLEQRKSITDFINLQKNQLKEFVTSLENNDIDGTIENKTVPEIATEQKVNGKLDSSNGTGIKSSNSKKNNDAESKTDTKIIITSPEDQFEAPQAFPQRRPSLAFNKFRKSCTLLKTPVHSRKKCADTTALYTPISLSTRIQDQLEALENEK